MAGFHEVRFPVEIALGARGGPERRTEIVTLSSGREERNARWALSRRKYDAGYGVRSIEGLSAIIAFFEERRGRLHGFRFRDRLDWTSAPKNAPPMPNDQPLGQGMVRGPLSRSSSAMALPMRPTSGRSRSPLRAACAWR